MSDRLPSCSGRLLKRACRAGLDHPSIYKLSEIDPQWTGLRWRETVTLSDTEQEE
jgi:hypothetical protein